MRESDHPSNTWTQSYKQCIPKSTVFQQKYINELVIGTPGHPTHTLMVTMYGWRPLPTRIYTVAYQLFPTATTVSLANKGKVKYSSVGQNCHSPKTDISGVPHRHSTTSSPFFHNLKLVDSQSKSPPVVTPSSISLSGTRCDKATAWHSPWIAWAVHCQICLRAHCALRHRDIVITHVYVRDTVAHAQWIFGKRPTRKPRW